MRSLLATAAILPALATAASPPPDNLNDLFAGTCMKYFYSQNDLREAMSNSPEVPPEKAEFFLDKAAGKAWFVMAPSTTYVVALRDDTVCAVFAQRANSESTRAGFSALVGTAPEPFVAAAVEPGTLGPNNEYTRTMAYSWFRPQDTSELLFVLTTSDSNEATAQAMASMSLVDR